MKLSSSYDPCNHCGGPHQFDTSVPSVLWNRVVRPLGWGDFLCTMCIVKAFAEAGVSFSAELSGDGLSHLPISVEINGAASTAPLELQKQNNTLRRALRVIGDAVTQTLDAVTRAQVDERGEGSTNLSAPRPSSVRHPVFSLENAFDHEAGCRAPDYAGPCTCPPHPVESAKSVDNASVAPLKQTDDPQDSKGSNS